MTADAANKITPAKLTPEGRVSVPAHIRHELGLSGGDRVLWVAHTSGYQLTTPAAFLSTVWANNQGGDAGDAGEYVRDMRQADAELEHTKDELEADELDQIRSDDEIVTDVLGALGL